MQHKPMCKMTFFHEQSQYFEAFFEVSKDKLTPKDTHLALNVFRLDRISTVFSATLRTSWGRIKNSLGTH